MSKKTFIVSYLPGEERSNTKKLLDHFLSEAKPANMEKLDLCKSAPDFFTHESLMVYYERNYGGQKISPEREAIIKKMDEMTAQFKKADIVIMAFPMHNFGMPGIVKTYFDSIMQKGETWTITPEGYRGMMGGKKALVLTSSGGTYEGPRAAYDTLSALTKIEFNFMGFSEVEIISAAGINMHPEKTDEIVENANKKVSELVKKWY
ncbi:MAG TPA: NAD(P)H-dependent oxidoreductase [Candidatus Wallbacteria bacterium]|nr:NAD(P)H-dependent oxidoreductase [Candidatus Wallbacteria bacterium]